MCWGGGVVCCPGAGGQHSGEGEHCGRPGSAEGGLRENDNCLWFWNEESPVTKAGATAGQRVPGP